VPTCCPASLRSLPQGYDLYADRALKHLKGGSPEYIEDGASITSDMMEKPFHS
jgi:hypothetical protein